MDFTQIATQLVTKPVKMEKVEAVKEVNKKEKPFLASYGIITSFTEDDNFNFIISRTEQSEKRCNPFKYFSHLVERLIELKNVKKLPKVIKVINLVNEPEMKIVEKLFEVFNLAIEAEVKIAKYIEEATVKNVNAYEEIENLEEVEFLIDEVINLKDVNVLNKYAIAAIMKNIA